MGLVNPWVGVENPWVGVKECVEAGLVCVGEGVASTQQQEPGFEHLWVKGGFDAVGFAALDVAAHRGELRTEPSDDTEAVKHMTRVWQTGVSREAL